MSTLRHINSYPFFEGHTDVAGNQSKLNKIKSLEKASVITSHKETTTAVAISNDNNLILSCAKNSPVKLHSLTNSDQIRNLKLSPAGVSSCTFLPDNKTIVLGTFDDAMYVSRLKRVMRKRFMTSAICNKLLFCFFF